MLKLLEGLELITGDELIDKDLTKWWERLNGIDILAESRFSIEAIYYVLSGGQALYSVKEIIKAFSELPSEYFKQNQ